ncbi:hypothetical protein Ajs_1563 [Acidovorax sp. JS42]|nr:hypothetical protein Ajs_1563 [Acidovorax sp. JS42]
MKSKQSIEAFARYHRSKEALAELTQIGAAAFGLLRQNVSGLNGGKLLGEFVHACQVPHWSPGKNFTDPVAKTTRIEELFCWHILVQQVSAFDLFTTSIASDLARFSASARETLPELAHDHALLKLSPQARWVSTSCCGDIENKFGDLRNRMDDLKRMVGWQPSTKLAKIRPLLELTRMARNRVVHSDGQVGSELEEFSDSKEVSEAHGYFSKQYTKASPPTLPRWKRGHALVVPPALAIFFGAVLYEFARELNIYASAKLTPKEFVEMAFFYSCVVDTHPGRTIRMNDTEGRIRNYLSERYLFGDANAVNDVQVFLKDPIAGEHGKKVIESTLWKVALSRHAELVKYEKANLPPNPPNKPKRARRSAADTTQPKP